MPTKTKVPARSVSSDDFVVEVDGVSYYPHAGESVTFVGRMTTDDLMRSMKMRRLDLSADNADEQVDEVRKFIAGRIAGWTWTDDAGEPYPNPPTPEVIGKLDMDELGWLLANNMGRTKKDEDQGEASTPST